MGLLFRLAKLGHVVLIIGCYKHTCGNGSCTCYKEADGFRMDCSKGNIHNVSEILKNIPKNIITLDLSDNNIEVLENNTFKTNKNLLGLRVLLLSNNKIQHIQKSAFAGLASLLFLNIKRNKLSDISNIIPGTVEEFDVSDNNIAKLNNYGFSSENVTVLKLKILHLHNDSLKEIEHLAFMGLEHLDYLDLSQNEIPFLSKGQVPAIFKPLQNLRELEIQKNLGNGPTVLDYPDSILSDIKSLEKLTVDGTANATFGPGFGDLKKLKNLTLSGLYTSCHIEILKNATFTFLTSLRHLDISYCNLTAIGLETLTPTRQLDSVDVSGNKELGYTALPNISFGLRYTNASTLKYSSMFPSYLGTKLEIGHLKYLNETKLKRIHFDDNALETPDNDALSYFPKSITYLSLQSNKLMTDPYMLRLKTLSNLEELDLSYEYRSRINYFPSSDSLVSSQQHRDTRSVSPNCINLGFMFPDKLRKIVFNYCKQEFTIPCLLLPTNNKLEDLRGAGNIFYSWQGPLKGLDKLKSFDLSRNYCSNVSEHFFSGMPNLQELYIHTNFIGLVLKKRNRIFRDLTKLRILDMSFNVITQLPATLFEQQMQLEKLNLSTNGLVMFDIDMEHMNNLTYLDLSANSLETLPENVRNYLDRRMKGKMSVDLSGNPIKCACDNKDFIYWLSERRNKFIGFVNYTFVDESNTKLEISEFNKKVETMKKSCLSNLTTLVISIVCCVGLVLIIVGCVLYRYRWKLRYFYYIGKSKYRGYTAIHGTDSSDDYTYDAFISYAGDELNFIKNELIPELEGGRHLVLAIHQRDFMAGESITENIVNAVTKSRKTVLVITENFLKSDWCIYEFRMAQMESNFSRDGRNIFVIVMLENVPSNTLPLDLLRLIQSQTYIVYPVNTQDRELFWNQVKDAIKQWE